MPQPKYRNTSSFYPGFPPGVKWLIIANTVVFVALLIGGDAFQSAILSLSLRPYQVVFHLAVWELVTYLFIHGTIMHWLFNMLTLWMFGAPLEQTWGTRQFLKFYFYCGIAAGLCDVGLHALLGSWGTSTIGASGAIYGLLAAFGVMFPDTPVLMFMLFPMKAKHMVLIFAGIEFLMTLGPSSGVSSIAHLGGMVFGYLYLKRSVPRLRVQLPDWQGAYRRWKMARARKKFQVYLRNRGNGPWTN